MRYQLFRSTGPKPGTGVVQSSLARAEMSGAEEAMRQQSKAKMDLLGIINKKDANLRVIGLGGTIGVFEQEMSAIKRAYEELKRNKKFECYAWIRIMHPFNPKEFLQSIVRELFVDSLEEAAKKEQNSVPPAQDLRRMATMKEHHLVDALKKYLNGKSFLIVLGDLSTMEEWERIRPFFLNNMRGSRLIVCAQQVEVASLCVGPEDVQPEYKQLSAHPALYAFYEKDSQDDTYSTEQGLSSNTDTIDNNNTVDRGRLTRMDTMVPAFKESQLIGRDMEKAEIIQLISNNSSPEFEVISIYGMGGLGKTTLVKSVYQSQEISAKFDKRACVTLKRPFDTKELLSSLAMQLDGKQLGGADITKLKNQSPLAGSLAEKKYLIVLDDLSSTAEWDAVTHHFPRTVATSRIVVTTRERNIAKHCSRKDENIYELKLLGDKEAHDLFTEKVFGKVINMEDQHLELVEEANLILKKCKGLPLAIVTIGGFLANLSKTPLEWRKLNEHIGAELEINQELGAIKHILLKSYEGLPYDLKSCFLYLSIFPEDHSISRRRLVRRWIAEGYSSDIHGKSPEEISDNCFMKLMDRSMILPSQKSVFSIKGIDSCQIHDIMREISIWKSTEENLVCRLEEGRHSSNHGKFRHLAISINWKGDKSDLDSAVDMSRIRSLTVFGRWKSFFISDKMRMLRVLELEGTSNIVDHHLEHVARLVHLKYVSLRGCDEIYHLPYSWGNLQQLETLNANGTSMLELPRTITKLRKLQYLSMGGRNPFCVYINERLPDDMLLGASRRLHPFGVIMPRGLSKLKALHTLGEVNISRGKAILQDIKSLSQLRKLAVYGINKKNCKELCSALDHLGLLESFSVRSFEEPGLHGFLDGVSSPPKHLQSLKLHGKLVKLPEWVGGLQNLVKLSVQETELTEVDATIQVLGKLPNLAILRLLAGAFVGEELRLTFRREMFPSLLVLQLFYIGGYGGHGGHRSLEFEEGATPKLELVRLVVLFESSIKNISGVASLRSLTQFQLNYLGYNFLGGLRAQLAQNPNRPVLELMSNY
ncbi:hypothetical protein ACP4OV_005377 [Aristida adscensionis]